MKVYILFLFLCSAHFIFSQKEVDTIPELDLIKIGLINQNDSYVTFPIDIGNIEPLLFEANVNPSFVIRKRKDSKLMAVFIMKIILSTYIQEILRLTFLNLDSLKHHIVIN
jgi:hypothetical protein